MFLAPNQLQPLLQSHHLPENTDTHTRFSYFITLRALHKHTYGFKSLQAKTQNHTHTQVYLFIYLFAAFIQNFHEFCRKPACKNVEQQVTRRHTASGIKVCVWSAVLCTSQAIQLPYPAVLILLRDDLRDRAEATRHH